MKILNTIQQELKVPKQSNPNVKYKSRSAEDILEMVKPLLGEAILTASFEPVMVGEWHYIKATVTLTHDKESISTTAYAREDEKPQFMSVAQGSGSTSSYALKYALNVIFAIDDTQDDDTREHVPTVKTEPNKKTLKDLPIKQQISMAITQSKTLEALNEITGKIPMSKKLTSEEKTALLSEIDIKAMDFEDVEVTPDTVPFNS